MPLDPYAVLRSTFGFSAFRDGQAEVVETILSGRDILVLFPTGNGKSLCYQVSGLCLPGLTLVITPLLALMQDQVEALRQKGVSAASWSSITPWSEKRRLLSDLVNARLKFLYLSPEKLLSPTVQQVLLTCEISQIVVDEAHCVSQWSPEFRPLYGKIPRFLAKYTRHRTRPILSAFTATATKKTCEDIVRLLNLHNPHLLALPFYRPNLRTQLYHVPSEAMKRRILLLLLEWWQNKLGGSALVYAATRGETEWLAQWISLYGFPAEAFHAGLTTGEKQYLLNQFLTQENSLLVCTSAFGMGVDKPNVRLVVHHTPPTSLEAYTQEAGRAGRDREEAWPVLLYRPEDLQRNFLFTVQDVQSRRRKRFLYRQALQVSKLAESNRCLNRQLFRYYRLKETWPLLNPHCRCSHCEQALPWLPNRTTCNNSFSSELEARRFFGPAWPRFRGLVGKNSRPG